MEEEAKLDQIIKIIELTKEGKSRPKIAKEVGCSKSTVYLIQKKFEVI